MVAIVAGTLRVTNSCSQCLSHKAERSYGEIIGRAVSEILAVPAVDMSLPALCEVFEAKSRKWLH